MSIHTSGTHTSDRTTRATESRIEPWQLACSYQSQNTYQIQRGHWGQICTWRHSGIGWTRCWRNVDHCLWSDHLPITTSIETSPDKPTRRGRGRLVFRKAEWKEYRHTMDERMSKWTASTDQYTVSQQDRRLTPAIMATAKRTIHFGNGGGRSPGRPSGTKNATRPCNPVTNYRHQHITSKILMKKLKPHT